MRNFRECWGGYRLEETGVQDTHRRRWPPVGESGGIHRRKIFKIEVIRNGISAILRPSQRVITSYFFFQFWEFDRTCEIP